MEKKQLLLVFNLKFHKEKQEKHERKQVPASIWALKSFQLSYQKLPIELLKASESFHYCTSMPTQSIAMPKPTRSSVEIRKWKAREALYET